MNFPTPVCLGDSPDDDNSFELPGPPPGETVTTPLFKVITDRPMPDFDKPSRSVYPWEDLNVGNSFYAGKVSKEVKGRLYTAIHTRKKKHPTEQFKFELTANGDLYVWKVAA